MVLQEIRGVNGVVIGRIEDRGYALEARNVRGILLASYKKDRNITVNVRGVTVATGNILASYITGTI